MYITGLKAGYGSRGNTQTRMAGASNGVGMVEDGPRPESFSVIFNNLVMSR